MTEGDGEQGDASVATQAWQRERGGATQRRQGAGRHQRGGATTADMGAREKRRRAPQRRDQKLFKIKEVMTFLS